MKTRTLVPLAGACVAAVLAGLLPPPAGGAPSTQAQAPPQLGRSGGAGMPAMQPPVLAPAFLKVGKAYRFILVRKELRGEVLEVDRSGWIRVHFDGEDDDIPSVPWLNLNHVTMIVPEDGIEPVKD